jgi:hypothetical protein
MTSQVENWSFRVATAMMATTAGSLIASVAAFAAHAVTAARVFLAVMTVCSVITWVSVAYGTVHRAQPDQRRRD